MRPVNILVFIVVTSTIVQAGLSGNRVQSLCPGECRPKCLKQESKDTSVSRNACRGNKVCCVTALGISTIEKRKQVKGNNKESKKPKSKKFQKAKASMASIMSGKKANKLPKKDRKDTDKRMNKQVDNTKLDKDTSRYNGAKSMEAVAGNRKRNKGNDKHKGELVSNKDTSPVKRKKKEPEADKDKNNDWSKDKDKAKDNGKDKGKNKCKGLKGKEKKECKDKNKDKCKGLEGKEKKECKEKNKGKCKGLKGKEKKECKDKNKGTVASTVTIPDAAIDLFVDTQQTGDSVEFIPDAAIDLFVDTQSTGDSVERRPNCKKKDSDCVIKGGECVYWKKCKTKDIIEPFNLCNGYSCKCCKIDCIRKPECRVGNTNGTCRTNGCKAGEQIVKNGCEKDSCKCCVEVCPTTSICGYKSKYEQCKQECDEEKEWETGFNCKNNGHIIGCCKCCAQKCESTPECRNNNGTCRASGCEPGEEPVEKGGVGLCSNPYCTCCKEVCPTERASCNNDTEGTCRQECDKNEEDTGVGCSNKNGKNLGCCKCCDTICPKESKCNTGLGNDILCTCRKECKPSEEESMVGCSKNGTDIASCKSCVKSKGCPNNSTCNDGDGKCRKQCKDSETDNGMGCSKNGTNKGGCKCCIKLDSCPIDSLCHISWVINNTVYGGICRQVCELNETDSGSGCSKSISTTTMHPTITNTTVKPTITNTFIQPILTNTTVRPATENTNNQTITTQPTITSTTSKVASCKCCITFKKTPSTSTTNYNSTVTQSTTNSTTKQSSNSTQSTTTNSTTEKTSNSTTTLPTPTNSTTNQTTTTTIQPTTTKQTMHPTTKTTTSQPTTTKQTVHSTTTKITSQPTTTKHSPILSLI